MNLSWLCSLGGRWRRRGSHHRLGTRGEIIAERFFRRKGWRVLARNARTPAGEADLVFEASDGTIILVEVKTRTASDTDSIEPARVLRGDQRKRLQHALEHLARANGWTQRARRIDLVVVAMRGSRAGIRHFPDAGRSA